MEFWRLLMHMIGIWCICGMLFWLFDGIPKKLTFKTRGLLSIFLALTAIYFAEMAPLFYGHPIRLHNVLPLLGALCYDPVVALICGILIGLEQLISHGLNVYPAEFYMPLISAIIGTFIWLCGKAWPKCRFMYYGILKPGWGFSIAFLTEALYMFFIYKFFPGENAEAISTLWIELIPSVICGAILAFVGLYVHNDRRFYPIRLDNLIKEP